MQLFTSINGKRTIADLRRIGLKFALTEKEVLQTLTYFEKYDIINYKSRKNFLHIRDSKDTDNYLILWTYLTNQCNYRCTYCFVNKTIEEMSDKTIDLLLKKVVVANKKLKYSEILLNFAGGEPLLKFESIVKINELIKKYNKKKKLFKIVLTTNGSLLTEKIASFFQKEQIYVAISLDGLGKANDETRKLANGKGTFLLTRKGIDIAKRYDILRRGILITITNKNIKKTLDLVRYALENNIKFCLQFFKETNAYCKGDGIMYTKEFINSYKKILKYIYRFYKEHHINESPTLHNVLLNRIVFTGRYNVSHFNCTSGENYFSVLHTGAITASPSTSFPLSNLSNANPIEKAQKVSSQLYKEASVEYIDACKDCKWKYICSGGCKLERQQIYKDLKKRSEQKCRIYQTLIPFILKLEGKRVLEKYL